MTTGTITTYDTTGGIAGLAGLAMRTGRALEEWGRRAAKAPTRDELERRVAIEREARTAIADRARSHQLLH